MAGASQEFEKEYGIAPDAGDLDAFSDQFYRTKGERAEQPGGPGIGERSTAEILERSAGVALMGAVPGGQAVAGAIDFKDAATGLDSMMVATDGNTRGLERAAIALERLAEAAGKAKQATITPDLYDQGL